ncbi:hypothetical protein KC711_03085, partial [Candidatus Peregrinibacteria bacterium]|nr:hypothetical protein [Candidatus Peregrinibacteria bacterium]
PFPDSYDTKTPKGIDPIRYMIAQKILWGSLQEKKYIDPDSTEAPLQRVEELKFRYASTNKDGLNNLCTLLRKIANEIKAIDGLKMSLEEASKRKAEILEAYGLKKWRGERKEGMRPMPFLEKYYEKWLSAGVLFKADLRVLDKELVAAFRDRHTQYGEVDPLSTESQRTEMLAAGILGDEHEQKRAYRLLFIRPVSRKITAFLRS